jgi:putative heme-binding domain-containing protein
LALSLGEWDDSRAAVALAGLAQKDSTNADMVVAIKSSASRRPAELFAAMARSGIQPGPSEGLIGHLVLLTAGQRDGKQLQQILAALSQPAELNGRHASWQLSAFGQCLRELERNSRTEPFDEALRSARAMSPALIASARALAADDKAPVADRISGLGLLGIGAEGEKQDSVPLAALLNPRVPLDLQTAALIRLGQLRSDAVATAILQVWPVLSPALRQQSLDVILRRPVWIRELLEAVQKKAMTSSELGASVRQRLLAQRDESLRGTARRLLAEADSSSRSNVVIRYLSAVTAAHGDGGRGAALFGQHCAVCHKLRGEGQGAAPDLASVVDRSPERMLIAILDPNRAVEDRYVNYVARVRGGDEFSGMLASENANSVTLVGAGGGRETILRSDLESLTSTKLSLMPEGFEQFLTPQDIADLLAHIR